MLWKNSRIFFCAVQFLLAATLFANFAAAQCRSKCLNAEDFYARAVAKIENSEYESAVGYLEQAIRRDPGDARFYEARGRCMSRLFFVYKNAGENAVKDFTRAIELKPAFAEAFLGRAIAYRLVSPNNSETKESLIKKTLADLDQAITVDPKMSVAYVERGMVYMVYLHDNASALRDLNTAVETDAHSVTALLRRAYFYQVTGDPEKAAADYSTVIRLDPRNAGVFRMRGAIYQMARKYDLAIADFTDVIKLEAAPSNFYLRGNAYMEKGDLDLAIADFTELIRRDPLPAAGYYHRALCLMKKGDFELAVADLTACIKREPSFVETYSQRAAAYRKLGKIAEAEADEKMAQAEDKSIKIPKP